MITDMAQPALGGLSVTLALTTTLTAGCLARAKRRLRERNRAVTAQEQRERARETAVAVWAGARLPEIARALSQGLAPPGPFAGDDAFARQLRLAESEVVRALVDARDGAGRVAQGTLLAVTRMLQGLLNRQQVDVTRMIERHDVPEVLADLLEFDHTTAQLLRRTQSLAVVCGGWPGRRHPDTVLRDVVRGAMGRILAFKRVDVIAVEVDPLVAGRSVEGLVTALAELLENATRFSHPDTVVEVRLRRAHHGVSIVVDDAGIGLPADKREQYERALSGAHPIDVSRLGTPPRFGLPVVGALAARYGFTVTLDGSPYAGVRAVVHLPTAVLADPKAGDPRPDAGGCAESVPDDLGALVVGATAGGLPKRRRSPAPPSKEHPRQAAPLSRESTRGDVAPSAAAAFGDFLRAAHPQRRASDPEGTTPA